MVPILSINPDTSAINSAASAEIRYGLRVSIYRVAKNFSIKFIVNA